MSRISLNKTQWSKIQPHLSGRAATGRPPADDKRTLEAILFVLTTGCRWRDLPSEPVPLPLWKVSRQAACAAVHAAWLRIRATIAGDFASICLCEAYGIVSRNGRRQREDGLQRITETCPRIAGRWNVSLPGWTTSVVWRLALSDFA
jgi:transposase